MPARELHYRFPWTSGPAAGMETMSLLDGRITGTVRADASGARYRARLEPFELGVFEAAQLAKSAVEQKATALINGLLAAVLPAELKDWLQHT